MTANRKRSRVAFLPIFLALVLIAVTVALGYRGWSFYLLSAEQRVEHPDFRTLRATGMLGNGYGWVAALLVIMNLSYLVRRRFGGFGSMRTWLDIHVFTGLTAATLVSYHSAFQLRTPVATLSAASLGVVVLTGLLGRFLYALAPTNSREALREALDAVEQVLPKHREMLATSIAEHPGPTLQPNASLTRSLLSIPAWRKAGRVRREMIRMTVPPRKELTKPQRRAVAELERAATIDARASGVSALLRSWRGLHRFFALLMLAAVMLHAGVAWYYGYRWIFT